MPAFLSQSARMLAVAAVCAAATLAQGATGLAADTNRANAVSNSNLDGPLFYQLLIGELELRTGDAGTAYQAILDAAKRTKDEQLFRRATEIALQARAGDQALDAVKLWREAVPGSLEALRFQVQLLVALNRIPESAEPLRALLQSTPVPEQPAMIYATPRFFARSSDHAAAAAVIEQAVQPFIDTPGTRIPALVAMGEARLAAQDTAKALELAKQAHEVDASAEAPAGLALELMPAGTSSDAEAIVTSHLQAKPDSKAVRLLYVRALTDAQRFAEAAAQLQIVTAKDPGSAPPWLTLGALQLELRQPAEAIVSLQKYVSLVQAAAPVADADKDAAATDAVASDDDAPVSPDQGLAQAYLLLAQAAEAQNDFKGAEAWLSKIDSPQRALDVQVRRASLLAKQGRLKEARQLIRRAPEQTPADARAKLIAEAALLRDAKQWTEASAVLEQANQKFPNDADLLYEQSMMAEKLNHVDEMERLLRKVIALKPDNQQAYNALGYSLADRNQRLPEARELIKKALDMSPGEPFITDSLGWVEYRMGHRDEAIRLLRGAYQSRPDPEIAAHLGEVLWVDGQTDEARRVWREAHDRDAANDVLRETLARLRVAL